MKYYSTNGKAPLADLQKAVVKGLAEDRGLYMPENIYKLPQAFFDNIQDMSFQDIAYNVAVSFFGDDVDPDGLQDLVYDTLSFDCPIVKVEDNIYTLELFHGPTLAFKDVGARFMARLLQFFINRSNETHKTVNVLVATSGDTGSAVANGFLGVEGMNQHLRLFDISHSLGKDFVTVPFSLCVGTHAFYRFKQIVDIRGLTSSIL